jgi:hypothetical protein
MGKRVTLRTVCAVTAGLLGLALLARPALADDPIRPDPHLTPGAILTSDTALVCAPGYSRTVRHTSGQLKAFVYREYGIDRKRCFRRT